MRNVAHTSVLLAESCSEFEMEKACRHKKNFFNLIIFAKVSFFKIGFSLQEITLGVGLKVISKSLSKAIFLCLLCY